MKLLTYLLMINKKNNSKVQSFSKGNFRNEVYENFKSVCWKNI